MISLRVQTPEAPEYEFNWYQPVLTVGRSQTNNLVLQPDDISSRHVQIRLVGGEYRFCDLGSTNGSVLIRDDREILLQDDTRETPLEVGDVVCLASRNNTLYVKAIDLEKDEPGSKDRHDQKILAEQGHQELDLETRLSEEFDALRLVVRLARDLAGLETVDEIGRTLCKSCLRICYKARRALFLVSKDDTCVIEHVEAAYGVADEVNSALMCSTVLLDRCLSERKGFLFLFEQDRVSAIATRISPMGKSDAMNFDQERIILCCPLFHHERCYGFIELDAPITPGDSDALTRRDLAVVTLMSLLVAGRLHDLGNQRARLKLARRATAGYLSATVGHCFKNLLFVPMWISSTLPICLKQGRMEEVKWMLARQSINIHYLDILSNEFAAVSKEPNEGFAPSDIGQLLGEVANLINQIQPEKIQAQPILPPGGLPKVTCHGASLRRMVLNLALNAVDAIFTLNRPALGKIELKATVDLGRDEFSISVCDNGPGIAESILVDLREIHDQVRASADALAELQNVAERVQSTKVQGFKEHYVLGFLFVCQTVSQHHGRLEIDSKVGEGSRFFITIPCHPPEPAIQTSAEDTWN